MDNASSQLGAGSNAAKVDRAATRLNAVTGRIHEARNMVMDCASTARRTADSILGSEPEADERGSDETRPIRSGELGDIENALDRLQDSFKDLFYQTQRLEKAGVTS